ncbi:MAG: hypothetical protein C0596_09320 [Marinilabiliales bacterium]|nr:MAG: hypothetical protein C0596_09320 [Marinilabiliales bacterium]
MKKITILIALSCVIPLANAQKLYKCINMQGDVLFELETHYVWPFSDGLAKFKTTVVNNGKAEWRIGFVNEKGEVVIEAKYDSKKSSKYNFVDGVSWVKLPDQDGFFLIDKTGKRISEKTYEKVGKFHEGMCAVYEGLNMGFVNLKGEEIIPLKYTGDPWFYNGLVCLCLADAEVGKYGFMDKNGEVAIPFQYIQAGYSGFNNGECRVMINGKTNLIDTTGKVVFTPTLTSNMEGFSCGLAKAYTTPDRKGVGFFNRDNTCVIKPIYDRASSFENGKTIVQINDKYGVIDTLGNYIIPLKFDNILGDCGDSGYFLCEKDLVKYYYNCDGQYFTQHTVKRIKGRNNSNYYPFMDNNDKWGYLNADGSYYIKAQYDDADSFVEGKAWVY